MKYILDTCTLIYLLNGSKKLEPIYSKLFDDSCEIYVSFISFEELCIKKRIDKLNFDFKLSEINTFLSLIGAEVISPSNDSLEEFLKLPLHKDHRDPFDLIIIGQAISLNAVLISSDKKFSYYESNGLKLMKIEY